MKKFYLKPVCVFKSIPEADAVLASFYTPEFESDFFGGTK